MTVLILTVLIVIHKLKVRRDKMEEYEYVAGYVSCVLEEDPASFEEVIQEQLLSQRERTSLVCDSEAKYVKVLATVLQSQAFFICFKG